MVLTIMLPMRFIYKLHDVITPQHVDNMCKIILLTGSIVGYAYSMEFFIAWYGGNAFEKARLPPPRVRPLQVCLLDDDLLQRPFPAAILVPELPA